MSKTSHPVSLANPAEVGVLSDMAGASVGRNADFQFVTFLPDGTELLMEDPCACRAAALRVEMLSRRLLPASLSADTFLLLAQPAGKVANRG